MSGRPIYLIIVLAWVALLSAGTSLLFRYESKPGAALPAPGGWPTQSRLRPDRGRPTLVMFVHPRCPCSRASLAELAEIVTRDSGRVAIHVLFVRPKGEPAGWEKTDLWADAARQPGVDVRTDSLGVEARLFGALTSGQAYLYGPRGDLLFRGGLTGGRGHTGTNRGLETVLAALDGRELPADGSYPVFGCALGGPADTAGAGEVACRRPQ